MNHVQLWNLLRVKKISESYEWILISRLNIFEVFFSQFAFFCFSYSLAPQKVESDKLDCFQISSMFLLGSVLKSQIWWKIFFLRMRKVFGHKLKSDEL